MITAAILARNSSTTIAFAIKSVAWCDSIFLLDDHSSDGTTEVARAACSTPLYVEGSPFEATAFTHGEVSVRNYLLKRVEAVLNPDAIVLIDADELMDLSLSPFAREVECGRRSSVSLSIFHLVDATHYIRYRETFKYGTYQIDPHVRVIRPGMRYLELTPGRPGHPLMLPGEAPLHLHGAFHFHLKYLRVLALPNTSLEFLPQRLAAADVCEFVSKIEFLLPTVVRRTLKTLQCPESDATENLPEMSVAQGEPGTRARCLIVSNGIDAESAVLNRVLERAAFRPWMHLAAVLCSVRPRSPPRSVEWWTTDDLARAASEAGRFDIVMQLSRDTAIIDVADRIGAVVRRGLTRRSGRTGAANIPALGYARLKEIGIDRAKTAQLATTACELE